MDETGSCYRTIIAAANLNQNDWKRKRKIKVLQQTTEGTDLNLAEMLWQDLRELCISKCPQTSMNWSNIAKKIGQNSSTTMWETDSHTENNSFKLLLPKELLEATEFWSVFGFFCRTAKSLRAHVKNKVFSHEYTNCFGTLAILKACC